MRHQALIVTVALSGCAEWRSPLRAAADALLPELLCHVERVRRAGEPAAFDPTTECIEVDREQLDRLPSAVQVGIYAHEVAHVIQARRSGELDEGEADWWAGCALARAGLSSTALEWWIAEHPHSGDRYDTPAERANLVAQGHAACREPNP